MFKYFFKELFIYKKFTLLFILNLSIGLTGLIAIEGFKIGFYQNLESKSKNILGADLAIRSRRLLTSSEIERYEKTFPDFKKSKLTELYSMGSNKNQESRLIKIKAIDSSFPFYGKIILKNAGEITNQNHHSLFDQKSNNIWVYPDILLQLNLNIGDSISFGEETFQISDVILEDEASGFSTSMAPQVIMSNQSLKKTNLLRPGSLAWHTNLYKIDLLDSELEKLRDKTFHSFDNNDVRVSTHKNSSQQISRLINYINDFLGLTSISALFLCIIGAVFLFKSQITLKLKNISTYYSLGLSKNRIISYYIIQLIILGLVSSIVSIILAKSFMPVLGLSLKGIITKDFPFVLNNKIFLIAFLISTLLTILIGVPNLLSILKLSPKEILNFSHTLPKFNKLKTSLLYLPLFLFFYALSIYVSNSFIVGSIFSGASILLLFIFYVMALVFLMILQKIKNIRTISLKWAIRDMIAQKKYVILSFICIGLGLTILNLIPQLKSSLESEISLSKDSKLPSFFIFDIQDEQVSQFKNLLIRNKVNLDQLSPMIRSRLTLVNGKDFSKKADSNYIETREQEREMRFRNRGFNLSFRDKLYKDEEIVKGSPFETIESENSLPQISIEERFAKRLQFQIGDKLTFDIGGVPIEGIIVNFRRVKWSTFRPNFFILFQEGVLEEAPKTYIATTSKLNLEKRNQLQKIIVNELPNVSLIDVSKTISKISSLISIIQGALSLMSLFCLASGLFVLFSLAKFQVEQRLDETELLKKLGADFKTIQNSYSNQFIITVFASGLLGIILCMILNLLISKFLLMISTQINWSMPFISFGLVLLVSYLIITLAINSSLTTKRKS